MGTSSQIITFSLLAISYMVILASSLAIFLKPRRKAMCQRVQTANKQITYVLTLQVSKIFLSIVGFSAVLSPVLLCRAYSVPVP